MLDGTLRGLETGAMIPTSIGTSLQDAALGTEIISGALLELREDE